MNITKLLVAAPILATLALTGCGLRATPEERIDSALDKIDATTAQRDKVHAATGDLFGKLAVARADRAVAKGRLIEQLRSDKPDAGAVERETEAMVTSLAVVAHAFVDDAAQIHGALDKGQREKLAADLKPGTGMRAAFFAAEKFGYGPPSAETMKEHAQKRLDEMFVRVDVDAAQQKALTPLALGLIDKAAPLFDDKEAIKEALVGAWQSDKADTKALHALVDTEIARISVVAQEAASRALQAHAILNASQRAKLIGGAV